MTSATTAPPAPATGHGRRTSATFRTDIQGLRAVAVVLVLLYHAGLPALPGGYVGVDVFFVISGFLITGLVLREIDTSGRLSLARFYARRVRRLLPATAVTFVGVAALTVAALPVTRWGSVAGDLVASSLYVVNWRLADRSVDYLAEGQAASPLQHFWSLAVEEQFYVVWPLLIVALVWWSRRGSGTVSRTRLGWGLLVLSVPTLVWSVWLTRTDPGPAYFVTTTRLWELAVGALLAVGARRLDVGRPGVRRAVGWAGLAAIVVAAARFDADTAFPGAAALLPTLGAAAVLWAGLGDGRGRVRLLDVRVMQDVGALSYSLYLWHWPLLVAAIAVWGDADGDLWLPTALLVVGFAVVPAWFTYRTVELPLHRSPALARPRRAALAAVVCVAVGLGAAGVLHWAAPRAQPGASAPAPTADPASGAAALGEDPTTSPAGAIVDAVPTIMPSLLEAEDDNADVYADGCHQEQSDPAVLSCSYGDEGSSTVVALAGDSHAAQWQPALRAIADERGWRLDTYTKSACLFGAVDVWLGNVDGPYTSCREWSDALTAQLVADPPDVLVTSMSGGHVATADGQKVRGDAGDALLADGLVATWQALERAGTEVVVLADTPWPGTSMPECVAENVDRLSACAVSRADAVETSAVEVQRAAVERVPGAAWVDLTDWICPRERCAPVIGGVLVYRDAHHLTATYATTLAPLLGARLEPLVEEASAGSAG